MNQIWWSIDVPFIEQKTIFPLGIVCKDRLTHSCEFLRLSLLQIKPLALLPQGGESNCMP